LLPRGGTFPLTFLLRFYFPPFLRIAFDECSYFPFPKSSHAPIVFPFIILDDPNDSRRARELLWPPFMNLSWFLRRPFVVCRDCRCEAQQFYVDFIIPTLFIYAVLRGSCLSFSSVPFRLLRFFLLDVILLAIETRGSPYTYQYALMCLLSVERCSSRPLSCAMLILQINHVSPNILYFTLLLISLDSSLLYSPLFMMFVMWSPRLLRFFSR